MGTFKLKTDKNILCFLESKEHGMVVGTGEEDQIVREIHVLSTRELPRDTLSVSGGMVLQRSSKFPLFERLVLQWRPIVTSSMQDADKTKEIEKSLVEVTLCVSKAEELIIKYGNELFEGKKKIRTKEGVQFHQSGKCYDDPTFSLKSIASDAIIQIVIALRKLPDLLNQITTTDFRKNEKFIDQIVEMLPPDSQDRDAIAKDKGWIKEIWNYRNAIEHSRWEIIPFAVKPSMLSSSNFDGVDCMTFSELHGIPISLQVWLNTTLANIISFIEDILLISLTLKIPPHLKVVELAESDRQDNEYSRFMLHMVK